MRKLTIALGITALSIGAATQAAPDAGGWCVKFDNYCDGLQLYAAPDGVHLTGTWENWDCAGSNYPGIHGNIGGDGYFNVICADLDVCPFSVIYLFKFERASSTFDMFGWDGVNPPYVQQFNEPHTIAPGTCNFANDKTGLPSSLAR